MAPGSRIRGWLPVAKEIFDKYMPEPNQIAKPRTERPISARDFLKFRAATITEQGLRWNIDVGMQYFWSWLRCVGLRAHL